MKLRVLGAYGGEGLLQRPTAFLVNERLLLDAGTVTGALKVSEQMEVEHAVVSHCHLDHIAGLTYLTETLACCDTRRSLTIAAIDPIIAGLRDSVFNNVLWPDFSTIPDSASPIIRYRTLVEDAEQRIGDLWVTPIVVSHTVPATGFIVHDGDSGFIYSGDTGPTEALWKAARGLRGLRAVLLECAFPNRLSALADVAKHMTPALIQQELRKLPPDIPVLVFHVKPQFYEETAEELAQAGDRVSLVEQDRTYLL